MRLSVSVKGWSTPTPAAAPDRPDAAGSQPAASRGGLAPSRSPREGCALRPSPAGTPTPPKTAAGCNPAAKNAGTLPGYHGRGLAPPVAHPRGARAPPPWPAPLQSARPISGALQPRRRSGDPNPAKIRARSSGLAIRSPFPVPLPGPRGSSGGHHRPHVSFLALFVRPAERPHPARRPAPFADRSCETRERGDATGSTIRWRRARAGVRGHLLKVAIGTPALRVLPAAAAAYSPRSWPPPIQGPSALRPLRPSAASCLSPVVDCTLRSTPPAPAWRILAGPPRGTGRPE